MVEMALLSFDLWRHDYFEKQTLPGSETNWLISGNNLKNSSFKLKLIFFVEAMEKLLLCFLYKEHCGEMAG